jgi:hypothetical protein
MDLADGRLHNADRYAALWLSRHPDLVWDPAVSDRMAHTGIGHRVAIAYPEADRRDGTTLDDALDTVAEMIATETRLANRLAAEVAARADDSVARFLTGLTRFVDRPDMWYEDNPRYRLREPTPR